VSGEMRPAFGYGEWEIAGEIASEGVNATLSRISGFEINVLGVQIPHTRPRFAAEQVLFSVTKVASRRMVNLSVRKSPVC